ncbi:MAG: hypothetical protein IT328_09185 [Caldilineaceae bacterium]|nr:hypothetical protein [Caldilineaceae bacterium]
MMLERELLSALRALAVRLKRQPVNWAITASCGLALQGVPVSVRDVDLATDRSGAYRLAQLFAPEMTRPVQLSSVKTVQSHYGAFVLEGYTFEIIGASQYPRANGGWDAPLDFTPHKHFVRVDEMSLPVLTLEFEYENYVRLGRAEKVKLLAEWLGRSG